MHATFSQAIKQARKTDNQCAQRAIEGRLYAFSLLVRTGYLSVHCQTMSGSVVCIPHGYMHTKQSRSIGKTANKRRTNDERTPKKRVSWTATLSLRNTKSQEVAP